MARLHSPNKGKSGSNRPSKKAKPSWVRYSKEEVEQLIVKFAKSDKTSSEIGIILRDVYGIPDVSAILNKKIGKILQDNKIIKEVPEDLLNLVKRELSILKHLEENKKDRVAKRGLQLTESKIHRLAKYYRGVGKLDKNWKYDREKAKLLIS